MKIRIKFRKWGVMKFIGHLDVMRYFQKAIRRADLNIRYSGGFSPHQIMSFAAPLGVGITSRSEYVDIELLDEEVRSACGSDMMSDVLAFSKDHSILLTGLCNPQVIRTAEMLDIVCIIFVRGKKPDESMLEMANERGLVILSTGHRMFSACGMLYKAGLGSGAI